jgi:hypothetical protein
MVEMDFAEVIHAALEQHVARAVAAGDGQIDKDFLELHSDVPPSTRVTRVTLDFSAALLAHHFNAPVLVDQKFPNRDGDKNGQSDAIPDGPGLADLLLFHHAILLLRLPPRPCLVTLCSPGD